MRHYRVIGLLDIKPKDDVEGYPIISDTEAIHIIIGEGFRKLKRVGQGSVNGDPPPHKARVRF
jgi:hypothetical protein